jgi:contractile injection system tube protein
MGLVKAKIVASEAGVNMDVMFNPKELQVDKSVSWTAKNSHSEDPKQEFKEPQSSSLSVTLYFDTYETKQDVYNSFVSNIEKTAKMVSGLGRPPMVIFQWGKFNFTGVTESVSQKYTMFLEDGTRCRCEVAFKMKSASAAEVSANKGS